MRFANINLIFSLFLCFAKHPHFKNFRYFKKIQLIMKNIGLYIILLFAAFSFSSCEKEDPKPEYFYSFKVNGVQKEFRTNNDAGITFLEDGQLRITLFNMVTGDDLSKNSVIMSFRNRDQIQLGQTYIMQNPITVNGSLIPSLALIYFDENGKEFGAILLQSANPGALDDCSFRITDFTTEGSTGDFEGVLFDISDTGPLDQRTPLVITEGKFFLPNFVSNE
jgi:hypothetical protein